MVADMIGLRFIPAFSVLMLVASSSPSVQEDKGPVETNVCDLLAHAKRFEHKSVKLKARVESAVIEGGTWLEDDACKGKAVELAVPDSIRQNPDTHPDFKALDDAIRLKGGIGTVGKKITAVFIGKFLVHAKRPKHVIMLDRVENLDVKVGGKAE